MLNFVILATRFAQFTNCAPDRSDCDTNLPTVPASSDNLKVALQLVLGVVAAATIIFIIINALRYLTSLGDPQANARLRNGIVYAAIGLIIVLSAEAIVTFVLGRF